MTLQQAKWKPIWVWIKTIAPYEWTKMDGVHLAPLVLKF